MKNILVADHLELICTGLTYLINHQQKSLFRVVATTHNGTDTFMAVEQHDIDVVIMELDMPGETGLLTLQRLHDFFPAVPVIVLSTHEDHQCIAQCFRNGAAAYVLKQSANTEILTALQHTLANETYLDENISICPEKLRELYNECTCGCTRMGQSRTRYQELTHREQEVLPLVTLGYANREIAQRLCISTKTVEAHKASIMRKLSLSHHVDLVHYAVHHHLVNI